jgi:hypothetical protein
MKRPAWLDRRGHRACGRDIWENAGLGKTCWPFQCGRDIQGRWTPPSAVPHFYDKQSHKKASVGFSWICAGAHRGVLLTSQARHRAPTVPWLLFSTYVHTTPGSVGLLHLIGAAVGMLSLFPSFRAVGRQGCAVFAESCVHPIHVHGSSGWIVVICVPV